MKFLLLLALLMACALSPANEALAVSPPTSRWAVTFDAAIVSSDMTSTASYLYYDSADYISDLKHINTNSTHAHVGMRVMHRTWRYVSVGGFVAGAPANVHQRDGAREAVLRGNTLDLGSRLELARDPSSGMYSAVSIAARALFPTGGALRELQDTGPTVDRLLVPTLGAEIGYRVSTHVSVFGGVRGTTERFEIEYVGTGYGVDGAYTERMGWTARQVDFLVGLGYTL